ncbi:hypothetical protein [Geofilum rubicundum]|uniref:hypothetical protein n=1 Tax=Geofilum rubicundum TaxID=472113 RepID=UPI000781B8C6|nr:hypothetical protein [Geofilum rubicundum]
MIISGTAKILNTSGIQPVKNSEEITDALPGEWYAGLVSAYSVAVDEQSWIGYILLGMEHFARF